MASIRRRQKHSGSSSDPQFSRCTSKRPVALLVTVTFLLAFASADGARLKDEFTPEEVDAIETFAGDILSCFDLPGLSIGVVRGRATFAKSDGLTDWQTAHPVSAKTVFNMGSTAKALVPYILAEIMNGKGNQDGRWNTSIKELLKTELDLEVNSPWAEQTLRDALVYSASGTPASGPFPSSSAADMSTMAGLPAETTREEIIRRAAHFMPEFPEFRSSGHYSNLMYTIVAHLAERLANTSWEQLVKEKVFDKNDMKDSHFTPAAMDIEDAALPHFYSPEEVGFVRQNKSLFDLHPFEPVGSLMASASDVAKWLRHLLHNLYLEGSDSDINMLIGDAFAHSGPDQQKPHVFPKSLSHDTEVTLGYGMGWEVSLYKGRKRYMYTGHLYAYTSHIWLFPDSRTAVYVVASGQTSASTNAVESHMTTFLGMSGILYQVSDILHREKPWLEARDVCAIAGFDEEVEDDYDYDTFNDGVMLAKEDVNYPLPPDSYTGSYGHGLVGDLVVEADETGLLTVRLGQNLHGELRPKQGAPGKLMLKATGWLKDTYEWVDEKVLEFLPASVSASGGKEMFQVIRLYLTEKLYYEFERGKMFNTMLAQAEEEEIRKAKEEEERKIREEKEAQMKEEAARKAREEEEKRKQEEIERKEMLAAVAREKAEENAKKVAERKAMVAAVAREEAAEKAREEAEKKAMLAAVAKEKAEEERMAKEKEERKAKEEADGDIQGQAAALEKTVNGDTREEATTSHNKANLVKKDDNLDSHQSHQPYSERKDLEVEVLPPEKVTDADSDKSKTANVGDKDGVGSGPIASTGMLLVAVFVAFVQTIIHRN